MERHQDSSRQHFGSRHGTVARLLMLRQQVRNGAMSLTMRAVEVEILRRIRMTRAALPETR